jgi:hypothetical protein
MSKTPETTTPVKQVLKESAEGIKNNAARMAGIIGGLGVQAKGLDMMMHPDKDVMSVPGAVKDVAGISVNAGEKAVSALAGGGFDAFKNLLKGGHTHSGPPEHGVNGSGSHDPKTQVR